MAEEVRDLGPDEFPIPFGIEAETGAPLPGLTSDDLERIDADGNIVRERGERGAADHLAIADVDPNKLDEAGWCVLFTKDADPRIKKALEPLLQHREKEAGKLFKVFEGVSGILRGDEKDVRVWLERQGSGFANVDPSNGVPLYILLVGSPEQVPFEFQYMLDLYWSVGRLDFDTIEEYADYAESVVAYETAATLPHKKRSALFCVKNDGDRATGLLHKQVAVPLVEGTDKIKKLAGYKGFELTPLLAEDATKEALTNLLSGKMDGGVPAFLFTGSHGVKFKMEDAAQREKQGAILCQDWPGFGAAAPEHLLTADDVPKDANLHGLIHFFFACYGGGCPKEDNFGLSSGQPPKQLVPAPIIARLPQRFLNKGALASFAHVDRAWAYSFQNSRSAPQIQEMRDVMVRILQGQRLGQAIDSFNMRWAVLSAELQEAQNQRAAFAEQLVKNPVLANRFIGRNDARNYIILGDPAVRLRTELMQ